MDNVLPEPPVRQWVLLLPYALRYLLATRPEIITQVPVPAPSTEELKRLVQRIAERIGRSLERSGRITRDIENACLAFDLSEEPPIHGLLSSSITYRIAAGPREGQKVFTLQTLPAEPDAPHREVADERLSLTQGGHVRYALKTP